MSFDIYARGTIKNPTSPQEKEHYLVLNNTGWRNCMNYALDNGWEPAGVLNDETGERLDDFNGYQVNDGNVMDAKDCKALAKALKKAIKKMDDHDQKFWKIVASFMQKSGGVTLN